MPDLSFRSFGAALRFAMATGYSRKSAQWNRSDAEWHQFEALNSISTRSIPKGSDAAGIRLGESGIEMVAIVMADRLVAAT